MSINTNAMKNFFGSLLFALSTLVSQAATLTTTTLTGADFPGWNPGTDVSRWYVSTTVGAVASLADSAQNGRQSIGSNAFFIRGATNGDYIDSFFKLGGGMTLSNSVTFDFVYSWSGGVRGIEFQSGTSKIAYTHSGSDALNFVGLDGTTTAIYSNGFNSAFQIKAIATGLNQLTLETRNLSNPSWLDTQVVALDVSALDQIKFYTGGISEANDNYGLFMNNFSVIPEPSSSLLMGLGVAGLAVLRLRRVRKNG